MYGGSETLSGHHTGGEDEWGCTWTKPAKGFSEGEVIKHPLDDWSKLKNYKFPDLTPTKKVIENTKEFIKKEKNSNNPRFIDLGFGDDRTWERYHFLRGFANAMMDTSEDNPNMYELLNKIAEINIKALEPLLELNIDAVSTMDDWGTQQSLMINPDTWRKIFKPIYKKYVDLVHQADKYIKLHSDGNTMQIIDDYIELGLDIYNPQFSCMNLGKLGAKVKDKLCICSDIDRQYILPRGKPNEVRKYVERVIGIFDNSNTGGLIGQGELGPDVPIENAEAMLETFYQSKRD
jgi:uroporphyrinogen decarboxylase